METVLKKCQDENLALNWEKCHFMVTEGTVLGHKIYVAGLEVEKSNISSIETVMPPTTVKVIRSFSGHTDFIEGL